MVDTPDTLSFLLTLLMGGTLILGTFVVILLMKSDLGLSRWLLSTTLVCLLLHLMGFLLFITQLIQQWPHLLGVTFPFIFLTGPSFYFFVKSYAEPHYRLSNWDLLHLIPFVTLLLVLIPTYAASASEKIQALDVYYSLESAAGLSLLEWIYLNLYVVMILIYVIAAMRYIQRTRPYNSDLLRKFCWLFLGLSVLYLILQSGFLLTGTDLITSEILLSSLMAAVVLLLGYWILDIRQLFPAVNVLSKYQTSPLSEEQAISIEQALIRVMEQEELYLNPRLKIADIANSLKIPSHHISQVLNDRMNTNFYQLLNQYRINKSKQLLKTDRVQQISIQGIGFDCGFSNKTSFYRAFKKITGMTPAEYAGITH